MKLANLSLVAAMLVGSSAFGIENTKISGNATLHYGTQDSDAAGAADMFDEAASYTNFAARLDLTTDLTKNVTAGVGLQVVTTLGVEHNLVDKVWTNAHTAAGSTGASFAGGNQVESATWVDEAWLAYSASDTTLKIGRQALDTPLAFTENWGVDKNTFEAVVVINQSLPDTTFVGTYIGKSNGSADDKASTREGGAGNLNDLSLTAAGYVAADGEFSTFGTNGTYAFGLVNTSLKPVTLQGWYYDMVKLAKAYWLQADTTINGVIAGAQYANTELSNGANLGTLGTIANGDDTTAYSVMLGYKFKESTTVKASYSDVDEKGTLGVANTATGSVATLGGQSKLFTEMWWNKGKVSASGAETVALTVETEYSDINWLAGIYSSENKKGATDTEFTEVTLTASKSFGPVSTSLALIHAKNKDNVTPANDLKTTDIQLYLKYSF